MLEVIDKGDSSQSHVLPVLFVHGANHAAWCWDEYFLDFFADKGYRALQSAFGVMETAPRQRRFADVRSPTTSTTSPRLPTHWISGQW